eukprot:SAG22_NODE_465_length_10181_cov_6.604444_18_plen_103_part_00
MNLLVGKANITYNPRAAGLAGKGAAALAAAVVSAGFGAEVTSDTLATAAARADAPPPPLAVVSSLEQVQGSDHCLSLCFSAFPCGSTALTEDRCRLCSASRA